MIVSASYKTDIPAFYGPWFMARLAAGSCRMVNPWGGQVYDVALTPEAVDGVVFWTKNLRPFRPHLADVRRHFPFVVQYTVNGYPRPLEPSVVERSRAVEDLRALAGDYGPRAGVWRYDPILVSSLTPPDWHRHNFARLAAALEGVVDEVVVSFAHIYRKTRRNLAAAARRHGFNWHDPDTAKKRGLIAELAAMAAARGIGLRVCAQSELLAGVARPARCIDAGRLSDVAGRPIAAPEGGNRPGCLCARSRDIGHYDTCPHGCVYCYAVQTRSLAKRRFEAHDPGGAFLLPPPASGARQRTPTGAGDARGRRRVIREDTQS